MEAVSRLPMLAAKPLRGLARRSVGAARTLSSSSTAATASTSSQNSASSSSSSSSASTSAQATAPTQRLRRDIPFSRYPALSALTDLAVFSPSHDLHPARTHYPPMMKRGQRFPSIITLVNDGDPAVYGADGSTAASEGQEEEVPQAEDEVVEYLTSVTELTAREIKDLYRFPLIVKRVVTMKSKGKMPSMYALVVVGNGKGLVGVGEGKDEAANRATDKAFVQAVRSMDFVNRKEDRTIWGEMESGFGSCKIIMRSRPPGFGLRVNHFIHRIAKAAGISDLSAKVHGSRNGTRVIKLAVAMLHGSTSPLDMGDGFGAKGKRRNKKAISGNQSAEELARMRGRRAVEVASA